MTNPNELIVRQKNGKHAVARFGVKSPSVDLNQNLDKNDVHYKYAREKNTERYIVSFKDGDKLIIDVADVLHDRYGLRGAIGYGLGKHPEEIETFINTYMRCSGLFLVDKESMPDELRENVESMLEGLLDSYSDVKEDE